MTKPKSYLVCIDPQKDPDLFVALERVPWGHRAETMRQALRKGLGLPSRPAKVQEAREQSLVDRILGILRSLSKNATAVDAQKNYGIEIVVTLEDGRLVGIGCLTNVRARGVPDVLRFIGALAVLDMDAGILVAKGGFTQSAKRVADRSDNIPILLLTPEEFEAKAEPQLLLPEEGA